MTTKNVVGVITVFCAAWLTFSLGNWQTRRAQEKLAIEELWQQAERSPPVQLPLAPAGDSLPVATGLQLATLPQKVKVRGQFLHQYTVWLENRPMQDRVGFLVVTPLVLEPSKGVVLVLRGWAPRNLQDRTQLPAVAQPEGLVDVDGLAISSPPRVLELAQGDAASVLPAIWQNLNYDKFEQASGLKVPRYVIQQNGSFQDGLNRSWARPASGVDRHRGYAVQWYALSITIIVATMFFVIRHRQRKP